MLPGIGIFTGAGTVLHVLVPYLRAKGFKVDSVWAQTLEAARKAADDLEIPFFTNRVDDVLLKKDVDLVFIMCPPILHAQIAVKALGIGKHVLCDRPGGLDQSETLKMVHAAQYSPSLISVMAYSLRFLPSFQYVRNIINEGRIGEVTCCDIHVQLGTLIGERCTLPPTKQATIRFLSFFFLNLTLYDRNSYDWKCEDGMGGGVLTTIGSHIIEIVSAVLGQRALRVHGVTRAPLPDANRGIRRITSDNFCSFHMEMSAGALTVITLNSQQSLNDLNIGFTVSGSGGFLTYKIDQDGNVYNGHHNRQLKKRNATNETSGRWRAGGHVTGCSEDKSIGEIVFTDTDELSFLPSSIVHNAPIQAYQRPYINGLFRMVSALRDAFSRVEDRSGWVKEAVASAATFEDGQYVMAVIDAVKRSNQLRQWTEVQVRTEEPDPNPVLSAAVRRSTISTV